MMLIRTRNMSKQLEHATLLKVLNTLSHHASCMHRSRRTYHCKNSLN